MITNEFFKGYHQALNTIEDNVNHLINEYEKRYQEGTRLGGVNIEYTIDALISVRLHIQEVRKNYKELQRQLVNEQKKE